MVGREGRIELPADDDDLERLQKAYDRLDIYTQS